jgi:hypothetical protein
MEWIQLTQKWFCDCAKGVLDSMSVREFIGIADT